MVQTLKRDAARLAATARGETSHRQPSSVPPEPLEVSVDDAAEDEHADAAPDAAETTAEAGQNPLADVYGFQELVLNRPAECAKCGTAIARGTRAYLGMNDTPGAARVWVCQDCLDMLSSR
jgi:hypothetical protein